MRKLGISTGVSRNETAWKKKEVEWDDFVSQLSKTTRTKETLKEFARMTKDQQDAIKDVGGFVGGIVTGGRRLKTSVHVRSMLTIDLDAPPKLSKLIDGLPLDCELFIYSTHSHTKAAARLRVIIPLSRDVQPDEYEAVIRKVTDLIGMDYADRTTFQVERLMYWPSTAKDGEFVIWRQEGEWLDPDEVLDMYFDWKDVTEWPIHPMELKKRTSDIGEQQDPTEKPGVIGAFCREFPISAAIEAFLSDEYTQVTDDRYTYIHGSTSGGVVTYEDKWAFSHHATDPAGDVLCNSFDLVRLHKFGRLDKKSNAEGTALPSYKAMCEWVVQDKRVKAELGRQRRERIKDDFKDIEIEEDERVKSQRKIAQSDEAEETEDLSEWEDELDVDDKGKPKPTFRNIKLILSRDPKLAGKFGYDEFAQAKVVKGQLPWLPKFHENRYWKDTDHASLRDYMETAHQISGKEKIIDALNIVMLKNAYHPVRKYLKELDPWDGKSRIDTLLIDFFDAEDNDYVRAVMRKTMVGAVKRVFEPGCKFETVLTLIGEQGGMKSTFFNMLGGNWFSDDFGKLTNNSAAEQIQGVWIMEIAELAAIKKAEVEDVKSFISRKQDIYRPAYGHEVERFKRQNIFVATDNKKKPLKDPTGNRRWWTVEVGKGELVNTIDADEVGLWWAEALHLYRQGELVYLDEALTEFAKQVQKGHTEQDDRAEIIATYLDTLLPAKWESMSVWDRREFLKGDPLSAKGVNLREKVTALEVWTECLESNIKDFNSYNSRPIHQILENMDGWEKGKKTGIGVVYHRISDKYERAKRFKSKKRKK